MSTGKSVVATGGPATAQLVAPDRGKLPQSDGLWFDPGWPRILKLPGTQQTPETNTNSAAAENAAAKAPCVNVGGAAVRGCWSGKIIVCDQVAGASGVAGSGVA